MGNFGCECIKHGTNPSIDELEKVTSDVVKWMNENCNPHQILVIRQGHVTLLSDEVSFPTEVPD